ncbi:unnamed protein product, partial [Angiostrongylus costaricensis]|uniref:Pyroglutamyl-peptidase 1 n=1 Tax=Angiostrongylus costaricensis TaxID=334426 RepID=A0A0R3PQG2_ANGCS
ERLNHCTQKSPLSDFIDAPCFNGKLVTEKISVAYAEVEEKVMKLWALYSPKLVVHIGVHPEHHHIKFEQRSFGGGYLEYDVNGCVPADNVCPTSLEPILSTSIDCSELALKVTEELGYENVMITASDDPGRYLCAYSFYISLSHDASRSLFIHVPPFDSTCTLEMVTTVVQRAITIILRNLNTN